MAAEAGWYPDPEGDATRLRYWDGTQWTQDYTAAPGYGQEQYAQSAADPNAAYAQSGTYANPGVVNADFQMFSEDQVYPMTNQDRTLRLIAFILNIISCVAVAYLIIPLAWMVPMTIRSWSIYKGKRPNTIAFGVCTLIFLNLIAGILLLISNKDTPTAGDPGNNVPMQ